MKATTTDCALDVIERTYLAASRGELWALQEYRINELIIDELENQGWKRRTGMTQNQKIIKHLQKAGSITVREALVEYSIQSLTKRVQELRQSGFNIVSTVKHHPITKQKYTRYTLA